MIPEPNIPAKPRVVLVSIFDTGALGARSVHAVLTAAGYPCDLVFFRDRRPAGAAPTEREYALFGELIAERKPAVVGVSLRSLSVEIARRLTREARAAGARLVVWGGTHPTLDPDSCLDSADAAVVGEGEGPMLDLVRALESGAAIDGIPNLCVHGPGGVVKNPLRPLIQDLDSLPFPALGNEGKFTIDHDARQNRDPCLGADQPVSYSIIASRGCPYSCDFCCNSALRRIYHGLGPYVRKRSAAHVVRELAAARQALPLRFVNFMDEVFTLDLEWNRELCGRYKDAIGLPFKCEVHPRTIDEAMVATMKDAGLVRVVMGVQSGSERSRRENYHRGTSDEEIMRAAGLLGRFGIETFYDFIFDNPYERRDDLRQTLDMILALPRPHNLEVYSMSYFPGTRITERALADGRITPDQVEDKSLKTFDHWGGDVRRSLDRDNEFAISVAWLEQLKVSRPALTLDFWQTGTAGVFHLLPRALMRALVRSDWAWSHPGAVRAALRPPIGLARAVVILLRYTRTAWRLVRSGQWQSLGRKVKARL